MNTLIAVGCRAGNHGDVIGNPRNQVPRIVMIEISIGQVQQAFKKRAVPQVIDQTQRYPGKVVVAQERTDALPDDNEHQQQRHAIRQIEFADQGDVMGGLTWMARSGHRQNISGRRPAKAAMRQTQQSRPG